MQIEGRVSIPSTPTLRKMACQPSSLISSIHRNLPYFTANPFDGVNLTNATFTVENILDDVVVM